MLQIGLFSSGEPVVNYTSTVQTMTVTHTLITEKTRRTHNISKLLLRNFSISWIPTSSVKRQTHVQVLVQENENGIVTPSIRKEHLTHVHELAVITL